MTVLLFSPAYPPNSGGAAIYYANLVAGLPESLEVVLITSYHPEEPIRSVEGNVRIYRIFPRFDAIPVPIRVILEMVVLFGVGLTSVLVEGVDVLHAHGSSFSVLSIGLVSMLTGVPVVYDCQDEGVKPWIVRVGNVKRWFSCAPNVDEILTEGGVPGDAIARTPVINPDYVSEIAAGDVKDSEEFEVVFVGAIRELKGVHSLLEGFARFVESHQDAKLVLIGDGPAREELEEQCHEYGLSSHVSFRGEIPHERALEAIARADVLVHPSTSETGPRSVTEAFELGTPVVATPVGIVPDIVDDGETGLLTDGSPESICAELTRMYADESLRASVAADAREVSRSWSWGTITDRVLSVYSEIGVEMSEE